MKKIIPTLMVVFAAATHMQAETMKLEEFSKPVQASVWVVNIPNENAAVKQVDGALQLHYKFTGEGQYLGVEIPLAIKATFAALKFRLKGNRSGSGYALYLKDADDQTHKFQTGKKIDWDGWKDVEIRVDGSHEMWGGHNNNNVIDYPVKGVVLEVSTSGTAFEGEVWFDDFSVETSASVGEMFGGEVKVTSPAYASDVSGDTTVKFNAMGFKSVTVRCWQGGGRFGGDSVVAEKIAVDPDKGEGSFVFPAGNYPRGPVTLTITGERDGVKDNCYLQLYNKSGTFWNAGIPKTPPPAAKGMKLVFEDDFTSPELSIGEGPAFRYYDHKPPYGSQDFSSIPFTSHDKPNTPFSQVDTYLRIRADANKTSTGLLSSMHSKGEGLKVTMPCYFEARFIGPNAIGSWPAFWLMTDHQSPEFINLGCDELDIIEAYGGEGPSHPNAYDLYMVSPHAWSQGDVGKQLEKEAYAAVKNPQKMSKFGIPSTWYESLHTYGCLITETDTVYYCDDIEIARHATLPLSKVRPHFLMINLATGGGWPVDLSRYNGVIDMYVDYIRVYKGGE